MNLPIAATAETAVAYFNLGNAHRRRGEDAEALAAYDRALTLDPGLVAAYNNRGNTRRRLGDHQGALEDYNRALQIDPNLAEAHNNRGNARRSLGAIAESIADYNQALRLNPDLALVYNNRANGFVQLGDIQSALDNYDQALKLSPCMAEALHNRGVVRYGMGDWAGAKADFQKAIACSSDYLEAHIDLRCLQVEMGEIDQAIAGLEASSNLFFRHGDDRAVAQIRRTLERVRLAIGRQTGKPAAQPEPAAALAAREGNGHGNGNGLIPGSRLLDEVRRIALEGVARRIAIKSSQGEPLMEVPLAVGAGAVAGLALLAPELTAVAALAALVSRVQVRLEKD